MPLTDVKVKNAKPQEKQYKLSDRDGMYLLVTPAGGKCWRLKYRVGGKEKVLAMGTYPIVTLQEARDKAFAAKKALSEGIDPGEEKKARAKADVPQIQDDALTFEVIASEWYGEFKTTWAKKTQQNILSRLEGDTFPFIGPMAMDDITPAVLYPILKRIAGRSTEVAFRVKTAIGQVFRYAVASGRATRNPVTDLRGALPAVQYQHYGAPETPKELTPILKAIDAYDGSPIVKAAMQLAPLLFVRPGELRHMEWSELDLEAAEWTIPAAKMKMKVEHLVPLSRQAIAILKEVGLHSGHLQYVFPCQRSAIRCMSNNAINAAFRRMGLSKEEVTAHGFRATARTILDEVLGYRPDIIEHQLAHAVKDPLGRAYNRTTHLDTRREMMQRWADYLDELKDV